MSAIVRYFEHSLALPFLGIGVKTDLFQSCGHCWAFQISWHIECNTFTASSFRIWNSSTGIPSPPLVLWVVMLSMVNWTSHSRISGPRCMITPSRLSGSWRFFLYSSSGYPYHLFLISSASVRSITSVLYRSHLWMKCSLGISNFFKRCLVFPIPLFSSISLHWSLRKAFLSLLAILWNSAFRCLYLSFSPVLFTSLLFTTIWTASPVSPFAFWHFYSMWMLLIPVSCTMSRISIHRFQAFYLSGLVP